MNPIKPYCISIWCLLTLVVNLPLLAQDKNTLNQKATVHVFAGDKNKKPLKGEQVIFSAGSIEKEFSGITDAAGKFSITLPAGYNYIVKIKGLLDTSMYGTLNIPALGPDQFFSEPFTINISYEPARSYTLDNVEFDFGKAALRPSSFKELEEPVDYLKRKTNERIEIAGHTDNIGKDKENLVLSQQRANSIKQYLVKKGIKPERLIAKGYGATEPIDDNNTETGRQRNRRTEVRIL
jgi:OmpA-OmpF porin, OOP family